MRLFFVTCLFLLLIQNVSAQLALSVDDAEEQGINVETLDSIYLAGIGADTVLTAFKGQENDYIKAYYALIHELGTYLNNNNFRWGGATRCFNRIYFQANGSIDYYLYRFDDPLSEQREEEFRRLLGAFIEGYQFSLQSSQNFSQCSPVNYRDIL